MPFTDVLAEADLPVGAIRRVLVDGKPIALARTEKGIFALIDQCPHAGAPLSEGALRGDKIACSWHGWSFDCATGACDLFKGAPSASRRDVRVEAGRILVADA